MRSTWPEWKVMEGYGIDWESGAAVTGEGSACTLHFYQAFPGDMLRLLDQEYEYAVAVYEKKTDSRYLYTYDYEPEENWTTYTGALSRKDFSRGLFVSNHTHYAVRL